MEEILNFVNLIVRSFLICLELIVILVMIGLIIVVIIFFKLLDFLSVVVNLIIYFVWNFLINFLYEDDVIWCVLFIMIRL